MESTPASAALAERPAMVSPNTRMVCAAVQKVNIGQSDHPVVNSAALRPSRNARASKPHEAMSPGAEIGVGAIGPDKAAVEVCFGSAPGGETIIARGEVRLASGYRAIGIGKIVAAAGDDAIGRCPVVEPPAHGRSGTGRLVVVSAGYRAVCTVS